MFRKRHDNTAIHAKGSETQQTFTFQLLMGKEKNFSDGMGKEKNFSDISNRR
jgi:hypothetical protein